MSNIVCVLFKLKKGIQLNIDFLSDMISINNDILNMSTNFDLTTLDDVYFNFKNNVSNEALEQITFLKRQLKIVNQKIFLLCEHIFTYDDIDIDLDHSKQICYCVKCEYSPSSF
jgi:hypothetical protein